MARKDEPGRVSGNSPGREPGGQVQHLPTEPPQGAIETVAGGGFNRPFHGLRMRGVSRDHGLAPVAIDNRPLRGL